MQAMTLLSLFLKILFACFPFNLKPIFLKYRTNLFLLLFFFLHLHIFTVVPLFFQFLNLVLQSINLNFIFHFLIFKHSLMNFLLLSYILLFIFLQIEFFLLIHQDLIFSICNHLLLLLIFNFQFHFNGSKFFVL
jgi:hypothetical protein